MKTNELRLGNYFEYHHKDHPDEWRQSRITTDYLDLILQFPEDYRPIPLTEEWFDKFEQFKRVDDVYWFYLESGLQSNLGFKKPLNFDGFLVVWDDIYVNECYYVHKMQNITFELTNNELIIK